MRSKGDQCGISKAEMALEELCLKCSKKPLEGFQSVVNGLEGRHRTSSG